jgi:predicted NBD/HSP70 family sugar kinase
VRDNGHEIADDDPRRVASRESVIGALQQLGALTRGELVARTSLSRATISSVAAELLAEGVLIEDGAEHPSSGGRRAVLISLNPAAGTALGIDFGKRHLRVAVSDLAHNVLAERIEELAQDHAAVDGVELAAQLAQTVLSEAGVSTEALVGIGMGLPGPIRRNTGLIGSSAILPGWVGVNPQELMSERLAMPVQVDNDANLGALAEWTWGAGRGRDNLAYLKAATGIGAGLILDGRPYRGEGGTAGEIGHTIIDPFGPICRCGNRGCLETRVGIPAILELFRPTIGEVTISQVIASAQDGDTASRRVLADVGRTIGEAAAHLCNLINPGCIILGGDLAAAGEIILDPLRDALARTAIPSAAEDAMVATGTLGDRAEVLGAVALALHESGRGLRPRIAASTGSRAVKSSANNG